MKMWLKPLWYTSNVLGEAERDDEKNIPAAVRGAPHAAPPRRPPEAGAPGLGPGKECALEN